MSGERNGIMLGSGQYYTLVASLRELTAADEGKSSGTVGTSTADLATQKLAEIREEILDALKPVDRRVAELLLALSKLIDLSREDIEAIYITARQSPSKFLREWAGFDYELRTAIAERTLPVLESSNILEKERAIDRMRWEKADELAEWDTFGLPVVLAYLLKLDIVARWAALDPRTGREMYDRLVQNYELRITNYEKKEDE